MFLVWSCSIVAFAQTTPFDVVVSGGLGCSIMPFRLGVPPEIVQVTLGAKGPVVS